LSLRLLQRYGRPPLIAGAFVFLFAAAPAWAAAPDVVGANLLWLALILMSAGCSPRWRKKSASPPCWANCCSACCWATWRWRASTVFDQIKHDPAVKFIAELGVIVLLLQIGLETRLADLIKVGPRALAVGSIGIVAPFVLGAFVMGPWLLPGLSANAYLFLGATLAATSVGITGRVFRDLGKLDLPAARIVLGAAVIDDVLGLVILAVVSSLVQAGSVSVGRGRRHHRRGGDFPRRLDLDRAPDRAAFQPLAGTARCRALDAVRPGARHRAVPRLAGACHRPGADHRRLRRRPAVRADVPARLRPPGHRARDRAPAGASDPGLAERLRLILKKHGGHQHEHMIEPIGYFFVPVFFVLTGMQVDSATPWPTRRFSSSGSASPSSPSSASWLPVSLPVHRASGWWAGAWCRAAKSA
jgi:hypothetical protein